MKIDISIENSACWINPRVDAFQFGLYAELARKLCRCNIKFIAYDLSGDQYILNTIYGTCTVHTYIVLAFIKIPFMSLQEYRKCPPFTMQWMKILNPKDG